MTPQDALLAGRKSLEELLTSDLDYHDVNCGRDPHARCCPESRRSAHPYQYGESCYGGPCRADETGEGGRGWTTREVRTKGPGDRMSFGVGVVKTVDILRGILGHEEKQLGLDKESLSTQRATPCGEWTDEQLEQWLLESGVITDGAEVFTLLKEYMGENDWDEEDDEDDEDGGAGGTAGDGGDGGDDGDGEDGGAGGWKSFYRDTEDEEMGQNCFGMALLLDSRGHDAFPSASQVSAYVGGQS